MGLVMVATPAPPAPSARRLLLLAAGWLAVGLAGLGAVLPLLPTTPFVLLAAAAFARSSPRFHAWLLRNRVFGPVLRDWREQRSIPRTAQLHGIGLIVLTVGSSATFAVEGLWSRVLLLLLGVALVVFLWRLPTTEERLAGELPARRRGGLP